MKTVIRVLRFAVHCAAFFFIAVPSILSAQNRTGIAGFQTRAQLESAAMQADATGKKDEAIRIRLRLTAGDFYPGDRVALTVVGTAGFSDTVTVAAGKKIILPKMGELPLQGVLRSELLGRLQTHVNGYLREAVVSASPLVRVAVLGEVRTPGFYYTSADIPISDVLMEAGGPNSEADINKTEIRRGTEVLVDQSNTRRAIAQGMSLDMLDVHAGDEIRVGKQRKVSYNSLIPAISGIVGVIVALISLR